MLRRFGRVEHEQFAAACGALTCRHSCQEAWSLLGGAAVGGDATGTAGFLEGGSSAAMATVGVRGAYWWGDALQFHFLGFGCFG